MSQMEDVKKINLSPASTLPPVDKQTYATGFVYSEVDKHVLTTNET